MKAPCKTSEHQGSFLPEAVSNAHGRQIKDTGTPVFWNEANSVTEANQIVIARERLYISYGDGHLDSISAGDKTFTHVAHVPTRAGARTSFFHLQSCTIYLAVPERCDAAAELQILAVD
jgi:hypothetical protein